MNPAPEALRTTGYAAAVFQARGLSKVYHMGEVDVYALREVDLELFRANSSVLLGPSGSGKSTLLNILGGLDVPTSGTVRFLDHDLTVDDDRELTRFRREHVGFVFQFYNLIPSLTALENVALVTDIASRPMPPIEALRLVGLADRVHHFPAQLSGGEQQRVAIARAIAKQPDVLLCDEPTGALDYETGLVVLEVLAEVNRSLGTTVAVITHNAAIAGMADRVIRMRSGQISEQLAQRAPPGTDGAQVVARLRPLHQKVLRDLWHLRSQMIAIALVMACGVAMFVTLRSMNGWLRDTQSRYYERYRFADVFANARRVPASVVHQLAAIPGVAAVRTRVVMDVTVDLPGLAEPGTGRLVAVPERRGPMINDLYLRSGRWVMPGHADEVLASEAFARANALQLGDSIPAVINGRWLRLRIVGIALSPEYIYEIRGLGDIFPDNRRFGVLWMGEAALGAAFRMEGAFNDVSVALAPGASEADVIDAIDRLLAPFGGTGAYGRADHVSNMFVSSEIEETQITSVLLPSIFLGVTAFLLNMVLARLVTTQRDQIAVLKAFGYDNTTIAFHYFQLALGPVVIGAILGTGIGIWLSIALARVYARFYQFPVATYTQDWGVVGAAFLVAGGAALLGAVGAVRRAVGLPPAEAMRPEAPVAYRVGVVERLGLQRLVSAADRIILRNIERRLVRAMLAVTGIALATAIVMTGWFMVDAIDVMKQIQFESVQRHDIMVAFDNPRAARAAWALSQIPGVRKVEPFRAVSARLRNGYRTKRTAITGLEPGSELQRLVDRDMAVRDVPRGGMLISDVLAGKLGVRPGDTITVEVLEGKRPVRTVVVAALLEGPHWHLGDNEPGGVA